MAKIVEVHTPDPKLTVRNLHKVPVKQWRKWSREGKQVFNHVHRASAYQNVITHPKTCKLPRPQWDTIRWNMAWLAADAASKVDVA